MKSKALFTVLLPVIGGLMGFAQLAHAADGTIEITGNITAQTCNVTNGGAVTVALPTVSASALGNAGAVAGRTPFTISLSGCESTGGTVAVNFESGSTVNAETGRLMVDNGGAQNVEIGFLNDTHGKIAIGAADQNSQHVPIGEDGKASLNYFAQYEATGTAKAGAANSRVQYSVTYQ